MGSGLPRVCIIGAGTSGVVCAKVMHQHGFDVDCFERGSVIGGMWRFANDNGMSNIYRSLHINTSKRLMQLSDFPFPDHMAEYPSHAEIIEYFEAYAAKFGIRDVIRFRTEVRHAERLGDGTWKVDIAGPEGEQSRYYDVLLVANGHHWDPRRVKFPGDFDGEEIHSHDYVDMRTPLDLEGKRVVVVGAGNSAMDIACELAQAGRTGVGPARVVLSQRSGVWITPKVLGNIAQDQHVRHAMRRPGRAERFRRRFIPRGLRRRLSGALAQMWVRMVAGDPSRIGLKQPQDRFSQRHPTISQDIHARLIHGDLHARGNIAELMGDRVKFEDGSVEQADVLIYCTGYNITFPFFEHDFLAAPDNDIGLWHRLFDPRFDNLAFIALVQPLCAMMPIAELQSEFIAAYLEGRYHLPPREQMQQELTAYHEGMKAQYTRSPSHTIQIDCEEYSYNLFMEWDAGAARADAAGNVLPVAPRVEEAERPGDIDPSRVA